MSPQAEDSARTSPLEYHPKALNWAPLPCSITGASSWKGAHQQCWSRHPALWWWWIGPRNLRGLDLRQGRPQAQFRCSRRKYPAVTGVFLSEMDTLACSATLMSQDRAYLDRKAEGEGHRRHDEDGCETHNDVGFATNVCVDNCKS